MLCGLNYERICLEQLMEKTMQAAKQDALNFNSQLPDTADME